MNRAQRYNFEQLQKQIDKSLLDTKALENLYTSSNNIGRIIDSIVKTKGDGWAAQVVNNDGKQILTINEQQEFTRIFNPYIDTILEFFDNKKQGGYTPSVEELSGMSSNFIKSKKGESSDQEGDDPKKMFGVDDIYTRIVNKIGSIDTVVNNYASKYGVLRLEKAYDLEPDPRIIPQPVAMALSTGITALSTAVGFPIPPTVTMTVLSKIKIPFRTLIFIIYLALDVARISMSVADNPEKAKILSVVLSILELLKGNWKEAIATFIGFYGKSPLLAGVFIKTFLSLFKKLSPQLKDDIIFGSLDVTKSFIIGLLLSIFQVTAPEEVRLPFIGILEKIAIRKAEIDGILIEEGLSARPDYLSPTFQDLNNIQAVMSDRAFVCSCEFNELVNTVNKSAIIRIILQVLRVPVNDEYKETYQCGPGPCKTVVQGVVNQAIKDKKAQDALNGPLQTSLPVVIGEGNSLTSPSIAEGEVEGEEPEAPEAVAAEEVAEAEAEVAKGVTNTATKAVMGVTNAATKAVAGEAKKVTNTIEGAKTTAKSIKNIASTAKKIPRMGGRILHTRRNKGSIA